MQESFREGERAATIDGFSRPPAAALAQLGHCARRLCTYLEAWHRQDARDDLDLAKRSRYGFDRSYHTYYARLRRFYRQSRVGQHRRPFKVLKFRTILPDRPARRPEDHHRAACRQREDLIARAAGSDHGQARTLPAPRQTMAPAMQNLDDHDIVRIYGAEYRGIVQYYLLATDVWRLSALCWDAQTSMLKILAAKHQSSVKKMAARHRAKILTPHGPRTCYEARIERDGKPPLVARFGGIPLVRDKKTVITDRIPARIPAPRKELLTRLLARRCELCGNRAWCSCTKSATSPASASPSQPSPGGQPSWPGNGARPSWPATPATTSSTTGSPPPQRRKSPESHVHPKVPAWFGRRPRGKGPAHHLAPRARPTQYRHDRARRTLRGIDELVAKAEQAVAGNAPVKRNRFIQLSGGTSTVNRELKEKARTLAGVKGYITNLAACPDGTPVTAEFVIGAYHQLFEIEAVLQDGQKLPASPAGLPSPARLDRGPPDHRLRRPGRQPLDRAPYRLVHPEVRPHHPPLPHHTDPGWRAHHHRRRPPARRPPARASTTSTAERVRTKLGV
jgi:Type II intron maturase/Bacterial sugar transferase